MIAQISGGSVVKYPVNLQTEFPNTSFPLDITAITLPDGYVFVQDAPFPSYDEYLSQCVETVPELVDGMWTRAFQVIALSPEQQAIKQNIPAANARNLRNNMLRESDWSQLDDAPLSAELKNSWRLYRQALRDVPQQEGFPNSIIWPIPPSGLL